MAHAERSIGPGGAMPLTPSPGSADNAVPPTSITVLTDDLGGRHGPVVWFALQTSLEPL
jgi:hypothetical protein